jgi:hypothetical protein
MKVIILNEATAYSPRDKLAILLNEILISKGIKPIVINNIMELNEKLKEGAKA